MKHHTVAYALGIILIGFGVIVLTPILVALIEKDYSSILPFCTASGCSILSGLCCLWGSGRRHKFDRIKRSDGFLIVTLAWLATGAVGAIPYLFFRLNLLDAYFESISGMTTTGATILTDFSLYPKSFFFWRSFTQWLGGMGIIVLFVAILPQFAVAGRRLFYDEAPGPTDEKITPRIAHTAKALWIIYVLLTVLEIALLDYSGMPLFDAICNGFSTLSAGGFSPHPQSIMGYQNTRATWIVTIFMFLAGSNFALQYRCLVKRKPRSLLSNEEFRLYCSIILLMSAALFCILFFSGSGSGADSLRDSLFQIVSIITTSGFSSADFALWLVPAQVLLLAVMLVGGCAGSAGGGIKVVRILFMGKYLRKELTQVLHSKAVLSVKIDKTTVPDDIQRQIIGFLLFYIVLMLGSGLLVTMIEADASVGFVGTAVTIGNIGPGFGEIGPMGSFGYLSIPTKIIFIINMVVGRLELIPFLAMLHPDFWG